MLNHAVESLGPNGVRSLLFLMCWAMWFDFGPRTALIRGLIVGVMAALTAAFGLTRPEIAAIDFLPILIGLYVLHFRPREPVKPSSVRSVMLTVVLVALALAPAFRPALSEHAMLAGLVILMALRVRGVISNQVAGRAMMDRKCLN